MLEKIKDKKKRNLYKKHEIERLDLLSLIHNSSLSEQIRLENRLLLNKLPRNSSLCRTRNRCLLTGRGRGVYRFCRMSRIKVRELASQGKLIGVSKSSW